MKPPPADQAAVSRQLPVPLIIVIGAVAGLVPLTAPTVQIPAVPAIVGTTPAFVVAVTTKLLPKTALAGAPVKVTVGGGDPASVV